MLAATPELAGYNLATAVILGDAARVRTELGRDPGPGHPDRRPVGLDAAARGQRLAVAQLDPARADGLLAVARMLLDAGADPNGRAGEPGGRGGWTPLRCAVAGAANPHITRLLLERGAVPGDHDLYLAGFGADDHECLRLLLGHAADVAQIARMALAAPISTNDTEGSGCCWTAGADPTATPTTPTRRPPAVYAAVRSGCSAELTRPAARPRRRPGHPRSRRALALRPGHQPGPRRPRRAAAPLRRRRRHHRHRPVPGRLPARRPGRGCAAAGPRPRAARPPHRRATGRRDDPRRPDRPHRGDHADARPRLPR